MADELVQDLRAVVEAERQRFAVPGCAVLVVADGEVVLSEGFGLRDTGHRLPVTERTLFPVGSSTKTFTAALCAALVDEGLLEWHRPVRDYLPDFQMADPVATAELSVFDLLSHRSGLPRHDLLWYAAAGEMSRGELVAALRHLEPSRGFREVWQYNNLLYTAAGEVAARIAGRSYEDALRGRILAPLGMQRTNLSVDQTRVDADAAQPYVSARPGEPVRQVPHARLDLVAPAGAVNSCVQELGPWLLTLLGRGVGDRPPLLSDSVLEVLRAPAMPLPDGALLSVGHQVGYGLGLVVEDYRGYRVVHHGGNIDGFSSQISHLPEAGCAVAVLTNRDGTALRDALPFQIYDRLLGLDPLPHGETLLATETALHEGRSQGRARLSTASAGLPAVRPLPDYAGRYRHPAYGDLVVTAEDGGLGARYRTLSGRLEHRHLEVFTLLVDLGGRETPLPVQFFHDLDAEVTAAEMPLEESVTAIRFERVPDTAHLTGELLDRLAGTYRLGPLAASVSRRGETGLVAVLPGGVARPLRPVRDLVFRMGNARVEFRDDGRLVTPVGEFHRSP